MAFIDVGSIGGAPSPRNRERLHEIRQSREQFAEPIVSRHGGQIIKTLDNCFLALFQSATDAVRAGMALTEPAAGAGLIRVGLATGDIEEISGDVFGEVVNLASRILGKTPPGQVWFSPATLMCMNEAEIPWEPVGRFAFKGIPGEREILRAIPAGCVWLPEVVENALRSSRLIRVRKGQKPDLQVNAVILMEDFELGSEELKSVLDSMPILDPANIWLVVGMIPAGDRIAWLETGRQLLVGELEAVDKALKASLDDMEKTDGSETIIFDNAALVGFDLRLVGLALPEVPMSGVIDGYTFDLLADGRWVHRSGSAILRVDVTPDTLSLYALVPGLRIAGQQLTPGQPVVLSDGNHVQTPAGGLQYLQCFSGEYRGFLLIDTELKIGISLGNRAEVGREPSPPGLTLPDRRGQMNLRWSSGFRAARAKESGFTMDRALTGRRQAVIKYAREGVSLTTLHQRCGSYVVDEGNLIEIKVNQTRDIATGELMVFGTSVLSIRDTL